MRTTLILDDRLFKRAKERAAARGITLSQVVNDALSESLSRASTPAEIPSMRMLTFGGTNEKVRHEPKDFAAAIEQDEVGSLGR